MLYMKSNHAKRKKAGIRFAAAMVAGIMLVSFAVPSLTRAASSADIERQVIAAINAQAANMEQLEVISVQNKQLSGTVSQYTGELAWLNALNVQEVALYKELVLQKEAALKEANDAYTAFLDSEKVLALKEAEYRERLQVMFEYREKPVLEVFLEAGNLQGFFSNIELIKVIADYDQRMLEDLEAARDDAELKRLDSLEKQAAADALVEVKQIQIDELKGSIQRSSDSLAAAQAQLDAQKAKENQLLAQSNQIAASIRQLQDNLAQARNKEEEERKRKEAEERARREAEERARQAAAAAAAAAARPRKYGQMLWPVPSSTLITSYYQPYGRTDLPGYTRPHVGVDIGGSYGAPIVAAADGIVILVYNPWEGWNTGGIGYGNYVIVDHGGRVATLYSHLRNVKVTSGQYLLAGDVLGTMGSTGNSTGCHLHFEVRVDGEPVDPMQYIGHP